MTSIKYGSFLSAGFCHPPHSLQILESTSSGISPPALTTHLSSSLVSFSAPEAYHKVTPVHQTASTYPSGHPIIWRRDTPSLILAISLTSLLVHLRRPQIEALVITALTPLSLSHFLLAHSLLELTLSLTMANTGVSSPLPGSCLLHLCSC